MTTSPHLVTDPAAVWSAETRGRLDGMTLLRFAHAYESGGGVERLLEDLDGSLLARHAMTIIRLYVASDRLRLEERLVECGRGHLLLVPLPLAEGEHLQSATDDEESTGPTWKQRFRDHLLYHPVVWPLALKHLVLRRPLPRRTGQVVGAGAKAAEMFARFRVNLCILHFFGGIDADEIITQARQHGVPFALQNHYANERFLHLSIRKHATLASGVAGVNGQDVPAYLRARFRNLADGIDTDAFRRDAARRLPSAPRIPLILLPARLVRSKGHLDLIDALVRLRADGMDAVIAFAGRVESTGYVEQVHAEVARAGLEDRVRFLGVLPPDELRDWYAASAVVALPTYHHEGLPRVIIEAQAMETPVVAYAAGGTSEGVVNGETGFLLAKGDIAGLTEHLARLLGDVDGRAQMGRAGRRFVEARYSLAAAEERHTAFYCEVAAGAGRATS